MTKQTPKTRQDAQWSEAQQRCRLSAEHIRRAKEMGLNPLSLIKNIPSPKQQWKRPVGDWLDNMYEERQEKAARKAAKRKSASAPDASKENAAETNPGGKLADPKDENYATS